MARGEVAHVGVPVAQAQQPRVPGALKGKVWMSNDFDASMISLWDEIKAK